MNIVPKEERDFGEMEMVHNRFLVLPPPAREVVAVSYLCRMARVADPSTGVGKVVLEAHGEMQALDPNAQAAFAQEKLVVLLPRISRRLLN